MTVRCEVTTQAQAMADRGEWSHQLPRRIARGFEVARLWLKGMGMTMPIDSSAATHVGRRDNNEDNFLHERGFGSLCRRRRHGRARGRRSGERDRGSAPARSGAARPEPTRAGEKTCSARPCSRRTPRYAQPAAAVEAHGLDAQRAAAASRSCCDRPRRRQPDLPAARRRARAAHRRSSLAAQLAAQGIDPGEDFPSHVVTARSALRRASPSRDPRPPRRRRVPAVHRRAVGRARRRGSPRARRRRRARGMRDLVEEALAAGSRDNITAIVVRVEEP